MINRGERFDFAWIFALTRGTALASTVGAPQMAPQIFAPNEGAKRGELNAAVHIPTRVFIAQRAFLYFVRSSRYGQHDQY